MANIPVNSGGYFIFGGGSITGSYAGMMALSTGSLGALTSSVLVTGLKYINGYVVVPDGKGFTNYVPTEATISTPFNIQAGTKLDLMITSCSLAAGSAPAILYY